MAKGTRFKADALAAGTEARLEAVVAAQNASRAVKEVEVLMQVNSNLDAKAGQSRRTSSH